MAYVSPGFQHIYRFAGQADTGWRVRSGWTLLEVLDVEYHRDDSYDLMVRVEADADWTHEVKWPPLTSDIMDDAERDALAAPAVPTPEPEDIEPAEGIIVPPEEEPEP